MLRGSALTIGLLAIGHTNAYAQAVPPPPRTGPYLGVVTGGEFFDDNQAGAVGVEFDTGFLFGGQFGYKFPGWRVEGELAYRTAEGSSDVGIDADVDVTSGTVGAFFDWELGQLTPYLGAGIGIAGLQADGDFEDDDSGFTWFGETGIAFRLYPTISIVPSYRYSTIDTDLGGFEDSLTSHAFRVGLRFEFGRPARPLAAAPGVYDPYPYSRYRSYPYYYDDYRYDDRDRPPPTPAERERNRCGWQGPGCPGA